MAAVGDRVWYVPDVAHALDVLADGTRAWDFESTNERDAGRPLLDSIVANLLQRGARPQNKAARLRPLAPRCVWPATILAVAEDGTASLAVEGRPPGCTFGMANVKYARAEDNVPHTWHEVGATVPQNQQGTAPVATTFPDAPPA